MNKQTYNADPLDRLLAQPALLTDNGFSDNLRRQLGKGTSHRATLIAGVASSWLLIALFFFSPQWITAALLQATAYLNFIEQYQSLSALLTNADFSDFQFSYTGIGVALLAVAAIVSLLVRE
ncbi:MAG: hypothetical protein O2971_04655 [Proteobacteria bacterium]|nr:hypothetical protein [Pseudomonadota bacterium]